MVTKSEPYFSCPVCSFSYMEEPPLDHAICACCGTHFGYDDVSRSYREIRNAWLVAGGPWFDPEDDHAPKGFWNAWEQLNAAGLDYDVPEQGVDDLVDMTASRA